MSKKTVLLVDDDETFLETTSISLEDNYNIVTAKDGSECFEKVAKEKPDLILLDVMMKHLGEGVDVAAKLKSDDKTKAIPIIMLTGVNKIYDMSTQSDTSMYKSDVWLEKPVDSDTLLAEVQKFIG